MPAINDQPNSQPAETSLGSGGFMHLLPVHVPSHTR